MTSLTNKIIGNIKKISTDFNSSNYINSSDVISIDTANNRLGINTKDPSYAMHIYNSNSNNDISFNNTIKSTNIIIDNLANIIDISCINILSDKGFINEISFNIIKNSQEINTNILYATDISNFKNEGLINFNELSGNLINVDLINVKSLDVEEILGNNLKNLSITDLSVTNIDVFNDANIKNLNIENIISSENGICNFNNICNFSNIHIIGNNGTFNELSGNYLNIDNINLKNLKLNNNIVITSNINNDNDNDNDNIILGNDISNKLFIYSNQLESNTISCELININNINISNSLFAENNSIIDISKSKFIIPLNTNLDYESDSNLENGILTFNIINNSLEIYANNNWQVIKPSNEFLFVKYDINNLYNRLIDNYINLIIDISNTVDIDLSNNNTLIVDEINSVYEINANINLKYNNVSNNDVEVTNYIFGLYSDNDISYTYVTNTIIAFGNINNYTNSSINYIGKVNKDSRYISSKGFKFYLKQENNSSENSIIIENFSAIIRKIN